MTIFGGEAVDTYQEKKRKEKKGEIL